MLVILGPTASGKTELAVQMARQLDGEILSADSRQVYRGMDIGTGKDLAAYRQDGQPVPYHLIDLVEAGEEYNVFRYQQDVDLALADVLNRGKTPIVCGGSGLYIEAALRPEAMLPVPPNDELRAELAPLTHDELLRRFRYLPADYTPPADTSTRKRLIRAIEVGMYLRTATRLPAVVRSLPPYRVIGLNPPVDVRRDRISRRLRDRLQHGLIEEVERLLAQGISADKLIFYGLEYKFVTEYVLGRLPYEPMVTLLETAIHQFAKRQMTFFRKLERDGLAIEWREG